MNPSPIILPDDLIAELLSFLPVKYLLRFKCVSKSWRTLISDYAFVKLHLKRSATQNPMFALIMLRLKIIPVESPNGYDEDYDRGSSVVPYTISTLLDSPSFTLFDNPYYHMENKGCFNSVGSCNGLILLAGGSFIGPRKEYWFRLWNPATKTISKRIGYFCDFQNHRFGFVFGFDDSTNTYKVVASRFINQLKTEVRIFSIGDDVWRNIESFPVVPLNLEYGEFYFNNYDYSGVYLSGAFNWLAINKNITNSKDIAVEDFVIVSLDLKTETYNQYLLPCGFDEVPPAGPTIGVLGGYLCFSYSVKGTDFVIWQMKKFGVQDSWIQFLKISYQNLEIDYAFSDYKKYHFQLKPLLLFEDRDTLMLKSNRDARVFLYNWRDNRVQRIQITTSRTGDYLGWNCVKDYVESLVPIN
ncbi:F-box/kelch-repeat protein At3g23880-like [Vicia villosa]|uniref:F-box/kelch-repeat protein At3g23880-like n=1 Tax=Vicia villosa TaxID=3911 RepID=UPI00273CE878|nr:F-box/kelch-repeat protein At3g23880-like [Vicia villosa]